MQFGNETSHWFACGIGFIVGMLVASGIVYALHPMYDCDVGQVYNPHDETCMLVDGMGIE